MKEAYQSSHQKYSSRGTLRPERPINIVRFAVSQIDVEKFTVKILDANPKVNRKLVKALRDLPKEDRRFDIKLQKWFVYSSDALRSWLEVTKQFSPLVQWGCRNCDATTLKAIVDEYEGGVE